HRGEHDSPKQYDGNDQIRSFAAGGRHPSYKASCHLLSFPSGDHDPSFATFLTLHDQIQHPCDYARDLRFEIRSRVEHHTIEAFVNLFNTRLVENHLEFPLENRRDVGRANCLVSTERFQSTSIQKHQTRTNGLDIRRRQKEQAAGLEHLRALADESKWI